MLRIVEIFTMTVGIEPYLVQQYFRMQTGIILPWLEEKQDTSRMYLLHSLDRGVQNYLEHVLINLYNRS